jgi:poly-gamma-glutamate capsule biosynthesis protein CapA/YwtB (metallophosphatase superfamily)
MGRIMGAGGKMDTFRFVIPGDPIPYLRMTQGQVKLMRIPDSRLRSDGLRIKQRIRAYLAYKDLVFKCSMGQAINRAPRKKVFLDVMIYFSTGRHGDPENVRKGIQDAIYTQDRMVAGSVDFDLDLMNPRVEVEISEG